MNPYAERLIHCMEDSTKGNTEAMDGMREWIEGIESQGLGVVSNCPFFNGQDILKPCLREKKWVCRVGVFRDTKDWP